MEPIRITEEEFKVIEILRRKPFQTVKIMIQNGQIVHIKVEESIKLGGNKRHGLCKSSKNNA